MPRMRDRTRAGRKATAPKSRAARSDNDAQSRLRVPLDRLTTRIRESALGFTTTRELPPLEGTIGQDRAMRARSSASTSKPRAITSLSPACLARAETQRCPRTSITSLPQGPFRMTGATSTTSRNR